MKKILVTGSEGYIGTVLVEVLLKKGYRVDGIDICYFSNGNLDKSKRMNLSIASTSEALRSKLKTCLLIIKL